MEHWFKFPTEVLIRFFATGLRPALGGHPAYFPMSIADNNDHIMKLAIRLHAVPSLETRGALPHYTHTSV